MSIYTISDLHLSLSIDKPMDIFGYNWQNYMERLKENWQSTVKKEDIVVIGGDISWATYIDECFDDFSFIESLNGKKIILKGNHDYWWESLTKLKKYILENNFSTISFLHNTSFLEEDIAICGARGWIDPSYSNFTKDDEKIYLRELERLIGSITRKVIKKILMEKIDKITVDTDIVNELLGKVKYVNNKIDDEDKIGVVTGLAYTEYGGDTLDVEVTYYKGGGHLVLTGKLGEVMKESAQAALSYVKSNAIKFDIDPEIFNGNDIHIHVPEGAIPKDGPSAGVTITTAIVSALSNHKVHHDLGMTGEITLRGRVLPIGGLKEKSIAAHRSGLNTILIPFENTKDIDDIPDSVKSALKIIPVKTIEEVIEHAIIK